MSHKTATNLYIDLIKRMLTRTGFDTHEEVVLDRDAKALLSNAVGSGDVKLVRPIKIEDPRRAVGSYFPSDAETMGGLLRLNNVQQCVETVLTENIPGDFIETGVWRGGIAIFMRALLAAYADVNRTVWVADSFEGLPPPNAELYPADAGDMHYISATLSISLEQVKANFKRYELLDEQVRFLKGWFKDTLPGAPINCLSVLRLDGDMYESTMDALNALYAKLSPGGFCIIDDYGAVPACKLAVHDFRRAHNITEEIVPVDWTCSYWRKRIQGVAS